MDCLKMYNISGEDMNFIENIMKTRNGEFTAGGKSLTELKIQRRIFQGDVLSPLRFVIVMMPLNHILMNQKAGYKLHK